MTDLLRSDRPHRLSLPSAFGLALLVASLPFVVGGCDWTDPALLEAGPGEPQASGLFDTQSRVFDGRDSVATGVDGLTATQANFTVVTALLAVQREGDDDVGSGFISVDDLQNEPVPSTPLFESRENEPILAPDGEPVTWGAFSGAEGAVIVKCTEKGTRAAVHLSGLIPKGVYSAWIDVFDVDTGTRIGRFALAEPSKKGKSKRNVLRASARGEGHITGLAAPRALAEGGTQVKISACMLGDVERKLYDWRVVGIYHIDETPGVDEEVDAGTFVEQVSFAFEAVDETDEDVEKSIE
jgi:hypothetical protein